MLDNDHELAQMTLGQDPDKPSGHRKSWFEVGTSDVFFHKKKFRIYTNYALFL